MSRLKWILIVAVLGLVFGGCASQEKLDDMKAQNRIQQQRISDLEAELRSCRIGLDQLEKQKETLYGKADANVAAREAEIAALEEDIEKKKQLITKLQQQLLRSGAELPMELSVKLEEFARGNDMVEFDPSTGMLKFKSDLLFDLGSANVSQGAKDSIKSLSSILNSSEAQDFDVIIAGHTDDVPIRKPSTRQQHPTNWHLSAHRAISVLDLMAANGVAKERMSVQGFGEYQPVEANKPGNKGSSANRRVEIYLVPASK